MKIATREDWNIKEMPNKRESFILKEECEAVKEGESATADVAVQSYTPSDPLRGPPSPPRGRRLLEHFILKLMTLPLGGRLLERNYAR